MNQYQLTGTTAAAIASSVEEAIDAGALGAGQALPTIRELATTLGVSPVTVAAAYRVLQRRGVAVSDGRRGTRVRLAAGATTGPSPVRGAIDLASGNPDPALLPALGPVLRHVDATPRLYGDAMALPELVEFAAGEFDADGIDATSMAVTSGALDAIERLLREHLRPGDRVAVEDPTLPGLLDLLSSSGFQREPVAVDDDGPLPDAVAQALGRRARACIVTPRAQNPTGAALTPSRAADLRAVLRRHPDVLLIENDACGPIAGTPSVTISQGATHPAWAVVRTTAKFLGPDLRVALVAGDRLSIARIQRRQALGVRWVSHLLQRLVLALWSDPSYGRRVAYAADEYARRRQHLVEALAAHGIHVSGRSGLNVWIPVDHETGVVQALAEAGWGVAAGERFRLRAAPGIRVTTSALAAEEARRFAADLAALREGSPGAASA